MTRIAVLGASSRIAGDLIVSLSRKAGVELALFARAPDDTALSLGRIGVAGPPRVMPYADFGAGEDYSAVFNFVGAGDPARILAMGSDVVELTQRFDALALDYLRGHPRCRYIFASSGAAYGGSFEAPVDEQSRPVFPIAAPGSDDWYGMAKAEAERRHRALPDLPIVDVRIFNYISPTQDLSARSFAMDAIRAIRDGTVLRVSADPMTRDYLHASDFCALIDAVLAAPPANDAIDCYSKAPVERAELLAAFQQAFGLAYEVSPAGAGINATGRKPRYYSLSRRAARYGYAPRLTSRDGVLDAARVMLSASVTS